MTPETFNAASPFRVSSLPRLTVVIRCVIAMAFSFSFALTAQSQGVFTPAVFSPPTPTSLDEIEATFIVTGSCFVQNSTVVVGTTVRTTVSFRNCIIGSPGPALPEKATFGPLQAGTYTYEIYLTVDDSQPALVWQQPLVVTQPPPPIPIASVEGYTVLAAILAIVAAMVLRRTVVSP